jgi:hypothetical protein
MQRLGPARIHHLLRRRHALGCYFESSNRRLLNGTIRLPRTEVHLRHDAGNPLILRRTPSHFEIWGFGLRRRDCIRARSCAGSTRLPEDRLCLALLENTQPLLES